MNKQEAIEKIKNIDTLNIKDRMDDKGVDMVIKNQVLTFIEQIDEPQKPVVPKFAAEWIEECKSKGVYLCAAMSNDDNKTFYWLDTKEKQDIFARAWLDGYKIEQEKLYTVEIPNPNGSGYSKIYLARNKDGKVELFIWSCYTSIEFADDWKQEDNAQLTESEIKQDFDFLWQFAKPVEEK